MTISRLPFHEEANACRGSTERPDSTEARSMSSLNETTTGETRGAPSGGRKERTRGGAGGAVSKLQETSPDIGMRLASAAERETVTVYRVEYSSPLSGTKRSLATSHANAPLTGGEIENAASVR